MGRGAAVFLGRSRVWPCVCSGPGARGSAPLSQLPAAHVARSPRAREGAGDRKGARPAAVGENGRGVHWPRGDFGPAASEMSSGFYFSETGGSWTRAELHGSRGADSRRSSVSHVCTWGEHRDVGDGSSVRAELPRNGWRIDSSEVLGISRYSGTAIRAKRDPT